MLDGILKFCLSVFVLVIASSVVYVSIQCFTSFFQEVSTLSGFKDFLLFIRKSDVKDTATNFVRKCFTHHVVALP